MKVDNLGIPVYSNEDFLDILYQERLDLLPKMLGSADDEEVIKYNQSAEDLGLDKIKLYDPVNLDIAEFDKLLQQNWLMPEEYQKLDIEAWLFEQIPPWDPETTRVREELEAFKQRNMLDLLRWMKYFVDTCRANKVVWGVGRGSSVASYVLFIIGVHRIDSIKYNLDWQEFLR